MKIIFRTKLPILFSTLVLCLLFQLLLVGRVWASETTLSTLENPSQPKFDLMLIGGGLKTCSSLSQHSCDSNVIFSPLAKLSIKYNFSIDKVEQALKHPSLHSLSLFQANKLRQASRNAEKSSLDLNKLKEAVDHIDKYLLNNLTDQQFYSLLDLLEQVQRSENGSLLQEQVVLDATKNSYGPAIYRLFTSQALLKRQQQHPQAKRPLIGIVTASARDPFESVSFYTNSLEQAGADVIWLPIDAALQAGIHNNQCGNLPLLREQLQGNTDKDRIYPKLTKLQKRLCKSPETLYQQLEQIDGLFLNGGDQSLTLTAWLTPDRKPSKALMIIKKRLANEEIVISGTSAGTAVMTENNMITGGTSEGAMQYGLFNAKAPSERCEMNQCDANIPATAVTYHAKGGLGFFPFGIMDTHFSERDRQIRLLMLTASTDSDIGIGVDENTALLVNIADKQLSVFGEHGIWIIEQTQQTKDNNGKPVYKGVSHYLTSGSQAKISNKKRLTNIELASDLDTLTMKNNHSSFQLWIKQACNEKWLSRKLVENYELIIQPNSAKACQYMLNNMQGYQDIKLLLRQHNK